MKSFEELIAVSGVEVRSAVSMAALCTYRVGGSARWFASVDSEAELRALGEAVAGAAEPPAVLVVGRGSNLLVSDSGFEGLAVQLGDGLARISTDGHTMTAGGAASLPVVARRSVAESLSGFEWAVGVPGTIGGAVRMNAGGHGSDMSEVLVGVRVVDLRTGETREVDAAALELSYRSSAVDAHEVVTSADLALVPGDRERGEALLADIVRWRRENQPGGHNAGSVFTNPAGDSAGRLIDEAGCKGLRIGSAEVSPKHANFIQADEGGSADDVHALMHEVIRRVRHTSGVELHAETRLVGFDRDAGASR